MLQVLDEEGVRPDIVCGSSIGALVGAAYAAGELNRFADWVQGLGMRDVFGFMDFNLTGGMLKGEKLIAFWRRNFADFDIESSPMLFGAVATDLHSGAEVWLRHGSIADAVRASIALPGLFTPVARADGRLLVDGGIVNPVPTSLARAMGADIVIGVDLNSDILHRHMQPLAVVQTPAPDSDAVPEPEPPKSSGWMQRLTPWRADEPAAADVQRVPSMLDVVMTSVAIMQMRITRSRMAVSAVVALVYDVLRDMAHSGAWPVRWVGDEPPTQPHHEPQTLTETSQQSPACYSFGAPESRTIAS